MRKLRVLIAGLTALGGSLVISQLPALTEAPKVEAASTFLAVGYYWYPYDSRVYCSVPIIYQSDGSRVCTHGYWLIRYPRSYTPCYRRNTAYMRLSNTGLFYTSFSGSLFYVC